MPRGKDVDPKDQRKIDKESLKILLRLLAYLKAHKLLIILTMVFGLIGTVFEIIGPYIMGNTTNYVVEGIKNNNFEIFEFLKYIYLLIFIYLLSYVAEIVRMKIGNKVKVSVVYTLREDVSQKMKRLPVSFFDKNPVGDLLSRMTSDIQTIGDSLQQIINQIFNALVIVVGITVIMFYISPLLTIITILAVPATILASISIIKKAQKLYALQYKDLGEINSHIEEMFSSNKLVKSYNYEAQALGEFVEKNERLRESAAKSEFLSGVTMPIALFINNLSIVAIAIVGAFQILKGQINIGNFQSFVQYSKKFNRPIQVLTELLSILQSGIAASERVFQVLDGEEEKKEFDDSIEIKDLKPQVSFNNVSFGYEEELIIKDLSVDIDAGLTVAIVGPTGSGKTTLVNLIMRFYETNKGSISIDGIDIQKISRDKLRSYIAMVLQDTWLFQGTIAENIAYGSENVSREEIIKAAKNAYAHDFIMKLPEGYNSVLEENADNISEGQKQLITIARALIANPKILILDEATSSIDTRTERLIQKAMERLVKGRTSFIIAHRLSTIIKADLILVIKDGTIIEKGSHEELLNKEGFYRELYTSQF